MNKQQENPFFNILFNIVIPVIILNKGTAWFGNQSGLQTLFIALAFPITFGIYEWFKHKRKSLLSGLGILNVLLTGGLAVLKTDGLWFAFKEAAFPLLIGLFIGFSAFTKKPFFRYLIKHSQIFNWDLIRSVLTTSQSQNQLEKLFKKLTLVFSFSFFISALLTFILALYIFSGTNNLPELEKELVLNKKIADMTWIGFIVIGLPMTFIAAGIFWFFINKLKQLTQLPTKQILLIKD